MIKITFFSSSFTFLQPFAIYLEISTKVKSFLKYLFQYIFFFKKKKLGCSFFKIARV